MIEAGIVLGGVIVGFAVGAWGVVQVLDIMEALDLRRIEKAKELQRAREYLRSPNKDDIPGTYGGQYKTGTSSTTTTMTNTSYPKKYNPTEVPFA